MTKYKSIVSTALIILASLLAIPPFAEAQTISSATARLTSDAITKAQAVSYTSARNSSNVVQAATATLTSNATNVSNADTVTVGNKTYTFKTALTPTEGEVLIGGNSNASLLNLIRAINHAGTPDTDYKCAAAHTQVTAAAAVTSNAFLITAITAGLTGDTLASTEAAATLSFVYTTFTGGGEIALDVNTASNFTHTLAAANRTVNIKSHQAGRHFFVKLKQDATGSRTVIWDADIRWSSGTAPTLTATASRADLIEFWDTGTYYLGKSYALNFTES